MFVDHLLKTKKNIKIKKKTGDSRYIYQNELDKACFQHDIAHGGFEELSRRTASDDVLSNKAFNIAKNSKCDEYQRGLVSKFYKFLIKSLQVVLLHGQRPWLRETNLLLKIKLFQTTTTGKIFEEDSSFHVKQHTMEKVQFLFSRSL